MATTKEQKRDFYQKNKERLRAEARARYAKKRESILEDQKDRRDEDPEYREQVNDNSKTYYRENRDTVLKKKKARERKLTPKQVEARRKYNREYARKRRTRE